MGTSNTFLRAVSNWQSQLAHFSLSLLLLLWFTPSYNIYDYTNNKYILSQLIYSALWILSYSLVSLKGFIILHDCGHNSFFSTAHHNEILCGLLSIFTLTPAHFWRRAHNKHHAIQGRSDKLDLSATIHFTVNDVKNIKNKYLKSLYVIYRFPFIFYFTTPMLIWFGWFPYISVKQFDVLPLIGQIIRPLLLYMFSNCCLKSVFYIHVITCFIPAFIGVVLFHVQHSHNPPYRKNKEQGFNIIEASVYGSYCHELPMILKLFTMGIEYHSLHHFDTSIPGYKLQFYYNKLHEGQLEYKNIKNENRKFDNRLVNVNCITYADIYRCMFNIVYDEDNKIYITWLNCVKQIYFC